MALIDSIDQMSETIFEYYKGLIDMFIESIDAILISRSTEWIMVSSD